MNLFPRGKHPVIAIGNMGTIRAAYVDGQIHGCFQHLWDFFLEMPDRFVFKGPYNAPLAVEDDSFQIVHGFHGPKWWHLVVRIAGEECVSEWVSADECRTWERVSPEVLKRPYAT